MRASDLSAPFYGVRKPAGFDAIEHRAWAAAQRMPELAFLCGVTAGYLHRLPLPPHLENQESISVAVPAPMRAIRAAGIRGRKLQVDPRDVTTWHGVRITTAIRTWCDLAVELSIEDLVAAGDVLLKESLPRADRRAVREVADRHPGRRGKAKLWEALALLDGRAESPPESIIRTTLVRADFTGLVANHRVFDARGQFIARVDLCFPAHRVVVEYLGDYHRTDRDQWRKDRSRIARLTAAGWHVLEIGADELRDPERVIALVRGMLALHPVR